MAELYVHIAIALAVVFLGALQLWLPKGTSTHRRLGYCLVVLMLVVAVGLFDISVISTMGGSSLNHIMSMVIFGSVMLGLVAIRQRHKNVKRHQRAMVGVYCVFIGAGVLAAFIPGRFLFKALFG